MLRAFNGAAAKFAGRAQGLPPRASAITDYAIVLIVFI
jgi:hypothetical protein